jgi:hypothetical protein
MSAGDFLFISGAKGPNAAAINGGYIRTSEVIGGYALYSKRFDPGMFMQHVVGIWQVKPVTLKNTAACYAYVAGGCAAEDCTSRMWKVIDGATFQHAPLVPMVAGVEAKHTVGAPPPPPPPPSM